MMQLFPVAPLGVVLAFAVACSVSSGSFGSDLLAGTRSGRSKLIPDRLGVNAHRPRGEEAKFLFDKVQQAGLGWVRLDLTWEKVEHAPGVFDWDEADEPIREAAARGLKILANIHATPQWANGGKSDSFVPTEDGSAAWPAFCAQVARRYDGTKDGLPRIDVFGIWNEPDGLGIGQRGDHSDDKLDAYVDKILLPCAKAIKEARPDALRAGPELASDISFLEKLLKRAGGSLDIVTVHKYSDKPSGILAHMEKVRSLVNSRSDWSKKPIWLTETGWATHEPKGCGMSTVNEKDQSRLSLELLRQLEELSWIEKTFFYELKDDAKSPGACGWGMLRPDNSEKPWFGALRGYTQASVKESEGSGTLSFWRSIITEKESGLRFASSAPTEIEAVLARSSKVSYFVRGIRSEGQQRLPRTASFSLSAKLKLANESYDGSFFFGLVDSQDVRPALSLIGFRVREPEGSNPKADFRIEGIVLASTGEQAASEVFGLQQNVEHEISLAWQGRKDGSGVLTGSIAGKSFRLEQGPRMESFDALGLGVGLDSDSNPSLRTGPVRISDVRIEVLGW